ncbi:MAG: succinate--CoA ligase subunit alpha [Nitrososphaerota archaeon]
MPTLLERWVRGEERPEEARVLVQGITGNYGSYHTRLMLEYGTRIVAGVTPGKEGQSVHGVPVYGSVAKAVHESGANVSVLFVPAPQLRAAAEEALEAGLELLVIITERVPIRDTIALCRRASASGASIIGPNTPGFIMPGRIKLGIMPSSSFSPGDIVVLSRSGTLTYEVCDLLSKQGLGQLFVLGVGGDPVNGVNLLEGVKLAAEAKGARALFLIGEIGGDVEERVAAFVRDGGLRVPVGAFIAGRSAPREKRMGHAGAIVYGEAGTAESKIRALREAGAFIARRPSEVPEIVKALLARGA